MKLLLPVIAVSALVLAGCPLPFEYNGKGASSHSADPSSPNMTAAVTVSYSEEGGGSGSIPDGGAFASGKSTTVTLSTASLNAVIFYTDDGTTLSDLRSANKIDASSGSFTVTRTTSAQSLDIHAVAVGPNMLPSPAVHFTVAVTPYPILTVTRNNATISEDGGTATFTITSSSPAAANMTVYLATSGDYEPGDISGLGASGTNFTVTLPQSATAISIDIVGQPDADLVDDTVTLTVQPDQAPLTTYSVGSPASASVVIQDNQTPKYTVTYNGNGNTGGTAPTDANSYVAGAPVTVAGPGSLVRSLYTFGGWNTAANGTGTGHGAGTVMTMGPANVTLYAVWIPLPTYTVTYNGNGSTGGTVPTDGNAYHAGDPVTILGPGSLVNSGGFFAGWNTDPAGAGATFSPGGAMAMGGSNVTLYAMWIAVTGGVITSVPIGATNVVIPEGVTDFGTAFQGHPNLVSVTLPSTIASINVQAFLGCQQLTTIASASGRYQVINGALVDTATNRLMLVPAKLSGAFLMPLVVSIDPYAFGDCTNLTSITIPSTLTVISGNGFSGLRSAIPIVLPPTVTSIGGYGFFNSYVTTIIVPSTVTSIGISAMQSCPNLVSVIMQGPPPMIGVSPFVGSPTVVHVPDLVMQTLYLSDPGWAAAGVPIVYP